MAGNETRMELKDSERLASYSIATDNSENVVKRTGNMTAAICQQEFSSILDQKNSKLALSFKF